MLGANDGIVSTASLLLGVAAAGASSSTLLSTGVAGLVAGAMSMAAGEYVSVSSQADTEAADLKKEQFELETQHAHELDELTTIYINRGLSPELAKTVATQLMEHDALGAHARDELGISDTLSAKPVQAALASAATFAVGALLPLAVTWALPQKLQMTGITVSALASLTLLGALAARAGGSPAGLAAMRVVFWGALAMGFTAAVGALFNVSV